MNDKKTLSLYPPEAGLTLNLPVCQLRVVSGPEKGKTVEIDRPVFCIGSKSNCDFALQDESVSRKHCEIRREPDGYYITDLQSTNGTLVDNVRIVKAKLQSGAIIRLGQTEIQCKPRVEEFSLLPSELDHFGAVLGKSYRMRTLYTILERIAPSDVTVLVEGETGTGKELLAQSLHQHSKRTSQPFMAVNCASIPKNLIESHLFGHEKGAFTGADQKRIGILQSAEGGTVFLDEIGELDPTVQPALLRVLESREITPLGSTECIPINVRVVAATHRDLDAEVKAGRFREDLFFRLAVVRVKLPALRERKEDIAQLVTHLLAQQQRKKTIAPEALGILSSYDWPGNIRELRNVLERAAILTESAELQAKDLLLPIDAEAKALDSNHQLSGKNLAEIERLAILQTLKEKGWNKRATARALGIAYSTLHEKIKLYKLRETPE